MSQNIASSYTKRQIINYRTRSPIRASDWRDLADHQNLVWARFVSEWGGAVYEPPFKPGGTTLQTSNSNGSRDLDELNIGGIATRTTDNITHGKVKVGVEVYADSTTVEVTITNQSTSTVLVNAQTFDQSAPAWHLETFEIDKSDVEDSAGNPQLLTCELKAADIDGSNASSIFAVRVGEVQLTAGSDVPSVASATTRYHGLDAAQQNRVLVALREDTMVKAGGGYPAQTGDITTPSDTDTVKYWADATNHRAFFSAGSDSPTYNSSASGLDLDSGEELFIDEAVDNNNLTFFEQLRTGVYTLAIKVNLQTNPSSGSESDVFGSLRSESGTGFKLAYVNDGGTMKFESFLVLDGVVIWDTGLVNPSGGTFPSSGFDTFVIEANDDGANPQVTIDINGTQEFSTTYSFQSAGSSDSNVTGIGCAGGTGTNGNIDGVFQGLLLDAKAGNGSAALDWIAGDGYTG